MRRKSFTGLRSHWPQWVMLAGASMAMGTVAKESAAQSCNGSACAPAYEMGEIPQIQPMNGIFKFQARISQAKMPVGEAQFDQVIVNLLNGSEVVDTEVLEKVQVRDSILNLRIGAGMNDLKSEIAEHSDLSFQVCLNDSQNCLKPVELSSVPYSVKAEYSLKSEMSQKAQVAAQCHYAHRVAADANLFTSNQVGVGYYDFHTPTNAALLDIEPTSQNLGDGYLQWTAVGASGKNLNVCAKDPASGELVSLDELRLHATLTRLRGQLVVDDDSDLKGELDVRQHARLHQTLTVTGHSQLNNTLNVTGATDLGDTLTVAGHSQLNNTLNVTGAANLSNTLSVAGHSQLNNSLTVTGQSTMVGATFSGLAEANAGLTANGAEIYGGAFVTNTGVPSTFGGTADFNDAVQAHAGVRITSGSFITNSGVTSTFNGNTFLNGVAEASGGFRVTGGSLRADSTVATILDGGLSSAGVNVTLGEFLTQSGVAATLGGPVSVVGPTFVTSASTASTFGGAVQFLQDPKDASGIDYATLTDLAAVSQSASDLLIDLSALEGRVDDLESDLNALTASTNNQLSVLTINQQGLAADVSSLQSAISGLQSDVNALEGATAEFGWVGYDLEAGLKSEVVQSVNQDGFPFGIAWNPQGTRLYILGRNNRRVYQYNLSRAWDLTSASYSGESLHFAGQTSAATGLEWSPDGSKLYLIDVNSDRILQYAASTAFSLNTATFDASSTLIEANPGGFTFSPTGYFLTVVGSNQGMSQHYLTVPFDVRSAVPYRSRTLLSLTSPRGAAWSPDGKSLYVLDQSDAEVVEVLLNEAYNVSSAFGPGARFDVNAADDNPYGMAFGRNGEKLFILEGSNDAVHEFLINRAVRK